MTVLRERELEPGHRLDRYELLCPIAQGGMAAVWLARLHGKHGFQKLVAVKTILPVYANDLRFQKMFLDEARIASGIEHGNVAQILDLGEQGDVLYLVMEWVDGDSLSKLFRACERSRTKLPLGVIGRVLADTCAGLHAAHDLAEKDGQLLGVVHRDVSPQNILVSVKGHAKLIDFGIAKARDRVAGETNTGLLKGKILYMAPEQAMGLAVDRRADVWAIGAVMYHLLAGVPPFEGANQLATLRLLTDPDPPPPLPADVPDEFRQIVAHALAKEPEHRIPSADDLQRRIEQAMAKNGMFTTHVDVASFVSNHLSERNDARKKTVDLALEAAAQRERLKAAMRPTDPDSASGLGGGNLRTRNMATPSSMQNDELPSSATLGSAAVVTDAQVRSSQTKRLALVSVVVAFATVALVVTIFRNREARIAEVRAGGCVSTSASCRATTNTNAIPGSTPTQTALSIDDLPKLAAPTSSPLKPLFPKPTGTATAKPTAKPASSTKKVIDDGF